MGVPLVRNRPAVAAVILSFALILIVTGCGTTAKKTTPKRAEDTGVVGVYLQGGGGSGSIAFLADGTFEGNAWGPEKRGTYTVQKSSGNNDVLVLKFKDSNATENWTVLTTAGRVVAVQGPDGVTYNKKK
jgi:hypothetical protein